MLLTWIREISDEPLLIDPTASDAEARENTWWLSTSVHERASLSSQEIVRAFEECASILRERIWALGHQGSATFYVWHDEQAGQLRCSTTSLPRDRLPFTARVEPNAPFAMIVEEFLEDAHPGKVSTGRPPRGVRQRRRSDTTRQHRSTGLDDWAHAATDWLRNSAPAPHIRACDDR